MASLRNLLNFTGPEELIGASGPVEGMSYIFLTSCHDVCANAYGQHCCNAWIVPAGVKSAVFEVWGGGGGGGGACCCMFGPPGASGAYSRKTVTVARGELQEGDRYALQIGAMTYHAQGPTGCNGCPSCICNIQQCTGTRRLTMCAQGGEGGCSICFPPCCGVYATSSEDRGGYDQPVARAFCGDININGVRGCHWQRCYDNGCYNKLMIPFPGGLVNRCGGVVMTRYCNRCCHYAGWENCLAEYIGTPIGGGGKGNSYIPGLGGGTSQTCVYCACGSPGTPGMIRITYK